MARIGANLCCLYNEAEEQKKFLSVITDAEWGIELGKLGASQSEAFHIYCLITFLLLLSLSLNSQWEQVIYWDLIFLLFIQISIQPVFRQQPEMKRNLIPVLLKSKRITPDIITQYCRSTTASPTVSLFLPSFSSSFFCSEIHILLSPCCSAFGLDHSSVINQYILTLLLQEQSEQDVVGDLGAEQEEAEPLCHADALERVLQLLPMLRNSSELTDSLSASISKVSTPEGKPA